MLAVAQVKKCTAQSIQAYDDGATQPYDMAKIVVHNWCRNEVSNFNIEMLKELALHCGTVINEQKKIDNLNVVEKTISDKIAAQVLEHRSQKK